MSNSKILLLKRKRRTRNKLKSVSKGRLRLSIFRSSKNIYAQIIDDEQNRTLVSSSTLMSGSEYRGKSSVASAEYVGEQIAREASKVGISKVYFDRGGYPYHGRVKAFAEAARRSGMIF